MSNLISNRAYSSQFQILELLEISGVNNKTSPVVELINNHTRLARWSRKAFGNANAGVLPSTEALPAAWFR
jgi:hypothetical protein